MSDDLEKRLRECATDDDGPDIVAACIEAADELARLRSENEALYEAQSDNRNLVKKLDVIWNGEDGAAKQASLCDMVAQIGSELPKLRALKGECERLREALQRHQGDSAELRANRVKELYDLMSDISEDCYCAGWMHGNEFRLWQAITDPSDDGLYGQGKIEPHQVQRLKELSSLVDGWWRWDDDEGAQFVSLERWVDILRKTAEREAEVNRHRPFCSVCSNRAPSNGGCMADDCGIRAALKGAAK